MQLNRLLCIPCDLIQLCNPLASSSQELISLALNARRLGAVAEPATRYFIMERKPINLRQDSYIDNGHCAKPYVVGWLKTVSFNCYSLFINKISGIRLYTHRLCHEWKAELVRDPCLRDRIQEKHHSLPR